MNQGKLEVVNRRVARVNTDILGISELKSMEMGKFNSDHLWFWRLWTAFLSVQCKELEENNRMGKKRDILKKKTGDTKGTSHARIGVMKDRNGKHLTEAEEINKRWPE